MRSHRWEVPAIFTFIDDDTEWTVGYTMFKKSESLNRFKEYKAMGERHTNQVVQKLHVHELHTGGESSAGAVKLKIFRSENGGEYLSNDFKTFLSDNGIKHKLTVAYTLQQKGVAERMNRTLFDLVRSMLHHSGILYCYVHSQSSYVSCLAIENDTT